MKAAIVQGAGQAPVYGDFAEPVLLPGESRVTVTASALSHLALGRAAGTHYSAAGSFPFVAGVDGVGRLDDGSRVYFLALRAPYGSMAEYSVARAGHWVGVPDALDDVTAAAIANPGMSSWAALAERAKLQAGETVLINGATGISGRLAVQIARHLGAKRSSPRGAICARWRRWAPMSPYRWWKTPPRLRIVSNSSLLRVSMSSSIICGAAARPVC